MDDKHAGPTTMIAGGEVWTIGLLPTARRVGIVVSQSETIPLTPQQARELAAVLTRYAQLVEEIPCQTK